MPERGNAANTICRLEESPVGSPRQNGELPESASSSPTWASSAFMTWIAVSGSATATWTCIPKMSSRRATYCSWSMSAR
jgi:hypothetical protein